MSLMLKALTTVAASAALAVAGVGSSTLWAQSNGAGFERLVLDTAIGGGYGVELADINSDGLQDIVALATNPATLVWYRNPDWQKFSIDSGTNDNIAMAAQDIDGDGDTDLVLASEFSLQRSTDGGDIHWLENPGDAVANSSWPRHFIDAVPTAHRVRWGDVNGDGKEDLLALPIVGRGASAPLYEGGLEFRAYQIPPDALRDGWPHVVLDRSLQMAHGLSLVDWNGDDKTDILTASVTGVDLFQLGERGRSVFRGRIGAGHMGQRPATGASEVAMGRLGEGRRFVATIEPWHGNEIVIYTPGNDVDALWNRQVIDDRNPGGHALVVADLDNDGNDEIVSGHRSAPFNVLIYRFDSRGQAWQRSELDREGLAASGLVAGDLNQDGLPDLVGIGGATRNVVVFLNRGR